MKGQIGLTMYKLRIIIVAITLTTSAWSGNLDDALRSFENNPGYSSPLATFLGTLTQTGFFQTAGIGQEFHWGMGIDLNLAYLSQDDVNYNWNRTTNCSELKKNLQSSDLTLVGDCTNTERMRVPTLFGGSTNRLMTQYEPRSVNENTVQIIGDKSINVNDGLFDDPISLLGLPLPYVRFEYEYTQVILRFLPLPLPKIKQHDLGFATYGLGMQHDMGHYLSHNLDFNLSLASSLTMWNLKYQTDEWIGELNLEGHTQQYLLLLGKSWGNFELNSEWGWEQSFFEASGSLTEASPDDLSNPEKIVPRVEVRGRNGFKMSINLLMNFGSYRIFGAQSVGAQRGNTINFMNFQTNGAPK